MKKVLLGIVFISSFLFGADLSTIESEIATKEAEIQRMQESLAMLKSQLHDVEKEIKVEDKKDEFKAHAVAGFIKTTGNTDTETYNYELKLKKNWNRHIVTLLLDGQFASDEGVETKDKFFTELEYYYEETPKFAFNYLVGYKDDRFSGYKYQAYTGPGMRYKFIDTDKQKFSLDGNILYSVDDVEESPSHSSYTDEYMSFKTKGVYSWQMLENLKFDQELTYRTQIDRTSNYFVYSKSMLSTKLSDMFSAGVSYKFDYINEAAVGKTSTDGTVTFNLIADY